MKKEATISENWSNSSERALGLLTLGLVVFGLLMVYSASFILAEQRTGSGFSYIGKQVLFAALGLGVFQAASRIPYHLWQRFAYPLIVFAIVLVVLTLIPGIGHSAGGASRWLGYGPFRFQPAELGKFAAIVFVCRQLSLKEDRLHRFVPGVVSPFLMPLPLCVLFLMQPDFGSAVMVVAVSFLVLFIAKVPFRYLIGVAALGVSVGSALVLTSSYRTARLLAFLDPWQDPLGKGFQILQSLAGFHHGGIFGVGLGNGKEKLFYLPEAHNDFIFAVVGEELGFVGVAAIILAFTAFVCLGLQVSFKAYERSRDTFALYLGSALTLLLGLQAFTNMAVVLGVLPTKGLTLPFISYGGSALLLALFCVGVLFNISRSSKNAAKKI